MVLKEMRILGKESLIYGLSTVLARLLNFILAPFYTHVLAAEDYGVVATVFAYIAFANIVYRHGMDQAYMRFASEKDGREREAFSTSFLWLFAASIIFSVVICLFSTPVAVITGMGAEYSGLLFYASLVLLLDNLTMIPFTQLRLQHRPLRFAGIRTVGIVVNLIANFVLLVNFHMGIKGVMVASVISSAITALLLLPHMKDAFPPLFTREMFCRLSAFAWPFVPAGLAGMMVQVLDRPIMMLVSDARTVGIYQANYRLGIIMMMVVTMFDQAWRPFFLERAKQDNAKEVFARVFTYFTVVSMWLALVMSLFIGDAVRFPIMGYTLIHQSYWEGLSVIPVILFGYMLYGLYINFMVSVVITKKTQSLIWTTLAGGVISVCGNLTMVPRFGMMGAAWTMFACYAVMTISMFVVARRLYPVPYEWRRLGYLCLVLAGCGLAYYICGGMFEGKLLFVCKVGIAMLFPLALLPAHFFGAEERAELAGMLRRGKLKPAARPL